MYLSQGIDERNAIILQKIIMKQTRYHMFKNQGLKLGYKNASWAGQV